ncbi:hypothetical protein [Mycobacterium decipiens]|uniref:hypothetical protein n=1 Tax=Mycobacterium decipiens TaxID=1430326 RepID=UPI0013FD2B5C|nr:hypothetical protein [Mycobacterium decipiens]
MVAGGGVCGRLGSALLVMAAVATVLVGFAGVASAETVYQGMHHRGEPELRAPHHLPTP